MNTECPFISCNKSRLTQTPDRQGSFSLLWILSLFFSLLFSLLSTHIFIQYHRHLERFKEDYLTLQIFLLLQKLFVNKKKIYLKWERVVNNDHLKMIYFLKIRFLKILHIKECPTAKLTFLNLCLFFLSSLFSLGLLWMKTYHISANDIRINYCEKKMV